MGKLIAIIMVLMYAINVYAGATCPTNLVSDHRLLSTTSTYKDYDCTCPDFQGLDFNLANLPIKIGGCRDYYQYKLDVTKFASGVGGSRIILWLDAYSPNGLSFRTHDFKWNGAAWVNNTLSTWTDKSGNAYNATQLVAPNQPRLAMFPTTNSAGFINANAISRPMMLFNETATTTYMSGAIPVIYTLPNQFVCFIVLRFYDSGFAAVQEYVFTKDGPGLNGFDVTRDAVKTNLFFNVTTTTPTTYNVGNAVDNLTYSGSPLVNDANLAVLQSTPGSSGASLVLYLNPYQVTYDAALSPSRIGRQNWQEILITGDFSTGTATYVLGAYSNPLGSSPSRVGIGEIIMFEKNLTHGERREIEMYLRRKWGIVQNNLGN